tara:strand:- start:103 stop:468 length:366 start_codon:yes stop_codon:yes gene_type:complete
MPTKKRRIGFIPRFDVLKVINKISEDQKLSNSKVVNILIEEALYARGLIKNNKKQIISSDLKDFVDDINYLESIINKDDFKIQDDKEVFKETKDNRKMYKRFIQFLHFKKMMNIFEEYNLY